MAGGISPRRLTCLVLAALLTGVFGVSAVRADMQVIESNAPDYPLGMHLPDNASLGLGKGCRVRVLLATMETRVIVGTGTVPRSRMIGLPEGGTRRPNEPVKDCDQE
jgi:hypothetical protein